MNPCDPQETLELLQDDGAPPARRAAAAEHARRCAACGAACDRWKRLSSSLFARPAAPSPAETGIFVAKVLARLEPSAPPAVAQSVARRWFAPALAAGLAVFVLSIAAPDPEPPADVLLLAGSAEPALEEPETAGPAEDDMLGVEWAEG